MSEANIKSEYASRVLETYERNRTKSRSFFEKAIKYLPGGDTRSVAFYKPFPVFMEKGKGYTLWDVDGNTYLDFFNNATSLIVGHAHPRVTKAVTAQVKLGSVYASPVESQIKLSQLICQRVPSVDKIRYTNSGTEAVMAALRVARAFGNKYKVLKIEGGYHGASDMVEVSVKPKLDRVGTLQAPRKVLEDASFPPNVADNIVIAPFNETDIFKQIILKHKSELGAVIVEPMLGSAGMIPADKEFLQAVRELSSEHEIPLIFDEVQSFRLTQGGAQKYYNVVPDLTVFGKIIGGGYPVGAVGGKDQYMSLFSPFNEPHLQHSGTFNGNPVTMTAGYTTMEQLTVAELYRINQLGDSLRADLTDICRDVGVRAQITGIGSMGQIHFTPVPIKGWREVATADMSVRSLFHLLLLTKGLFFSKRLMFNISTPMRERQISLAAQIFRECLVQLIPYLEVTAPSLLV